jgi:ABC-type polysaccharide/polyol phosphate export permease
MSPLKDLNALYRYREVVLNLASADLKLRYRRSFLGYAWSLLYPLLTMSIMAVVFTRAMGFGSMKNYVIYIFAGFLPWNFLVNGFWGAGSSLINNESILRKVYLPKLIFPISVTLARFLDFLCNLLALFIVITFAAGYRPNAAVIALPGAVLLLFFFTTGVTLALSAINVYIRDTNHLVAVMMQLGFYLTPIIYNVEDTKVVPEKFRPIFELNPMTHIIRLFQDILWRGEFPPAEHWAMAGGIAALAMLLGYAIFSKLERNLIFRL